MIKTYLFAFIALCAFAANSILCRLALGENYIDAANFTSIRLFSGALTFLVIWLFHKQPSISIQRKHLAGGAMLFIYAVCFSFAYIQLETGTGALVLFASVQLALLSYSFIKGISVSFLELLGMFVAFLGLCFLVYPTITTPNAKGVFLMITAGIAWGGYTLVGRGSNNATLDTGLNFMVSVPLTFLLVIFISSPQTMSAIGVILAALSGIVASAFGYSVWYVVVKEITPNIAGVIQLIVPILAAIGGAVFIDEFITLHQIMAATLILGGIAMVFNIKKKN